MGRPPLRQHRYAGAATGFVAGQRIQARSGRVRFEWCAGEAMYRAAEGIGADDRSRRRRESTRPCPTDAAQAVEATVCPAASWSTNIDSHTAVSSTIGANGICRVSGLVIREILTAGSADVQRRSRWTRKSTPTRPLGPRMRGRQPRNSAGGRNNSITRAKIQTARDCTNLGMTFPTRAPVSRRKPVIRRVFGHVWPLPHSTWQPT